MPLIALSAPIRNDPPVLPDVLRTEIELSGHDEGAELIQTMFGVGPELLRDGEGWANDTFMRFGSEAAVKDAGKLQVEGKEYVVSDGDILHIRFNV